ncbi:MAG: type II toxin-antitoxin system prevent-host-death family antitoxin [Actinomycetota bacterium]|nr:type II toxin-antitoxin system prevent-host-death family antitoxin [Actinomycetota bacterium]
MTRSVAVRELRNHTAEVLRRVRAGDDVTITQNGVPVATLVPVDRLVAPMLKADLIRVLDQSRTDSTFAADIAALTWDSTDDLGPIQ